MSATDEKTATSKPQKAQKQKTFTKQLGGSASAPAAQTAPPIPSSTENRAGGLRSEITITLQTRAASKLWYGRRESNQNNKAALLGAVKFAALVRNITEAAAIDDPYADWWLLRLQTGLLEARDRLTKYSDTIEKFVAAQIPEGLSVGEALSINAEQISLRFATPFGFMAAYLIADFDKVARKVLLGRHIALLDTAMSERMLFEGSKIVRFAISQVHGYRFTGVTRADIAANSPNAQRAFESMGKCPDDVLSGEKRSDYAPINFKLLGQKGLNPSPQESAVATLAAITEGLEVEAEPDDIAETEALDLDSSEE